MLLVTALLISCRHKDAKTDDDGDGVMADVDCEDSSAAIGEASPWYPDADGDGHGTDADAVTSCIAPVGHVADNLDCDDANGDVHPGATEDDCADPVDYNCDKSTGYDDLDGDGSPACKDCDDNDDVTDPAGPTWYADLDGDGHGGTRLTAVACSAPTGFVDSLDDCDDLDATAFPGASEVCDGVDDDCNGTADDNDPTGTTTFYQDLDEDGYGDVDLTTDACTAPDGYVANPDDCDDASETAAPGRPETCNAKDDDCNGRIDDDVTDGTTFYGDVDGDGFGSILFTTSACAAPPYYVTTADDCDDSDDTFHPDATEYCDGLDRDCDGAINEPSSVDATSWYLDADNDSFGASTAELACSQPAGRVEATGDCDDTVTNIHPGAAELCNGGVDDDCDSSTPDNCIRASCKDWKSAGFNADGIYNIDPDGAGGAAAYNVTCEMDEDGGGWERCFTLTNTAAEDLTGNTWFDKCVTAAMATNHIGTEVRVALHDAGGVSLYRGFGTRPSGWTFDNLTSTIDANSQYHSDNHISTANGRIVPLDNGDKLMIAGRFSSNSGYGGSFGDGYGIVVYPPAPNYYFNPKMIVAGYRGGISGQVRSFTGWSTDREITYQSPSFTTAPPGPMPAGTIGTFDFYVR